MLENELKVKVGELAANKEETMKADKKVRRPKKQKKAAALRQLAQDIHKLHAAAARKDKVRADLILNAMRTAWKNKSKPCFRGAWDAMKKLALS